MLLIPKAFYRHKDGGVYQLDIVSSISTVDKTDWVVYTHVYPFEVRTYHRPKEEFCDGRFTELVPNEVKELFSRNREKFQQEIAEAKVKGKG